MLTINGYRSLFQTLNKELGVVASVAMHEGLDFVILWGMKRQDWAAAIM